MFRILEELKIIKPIKISKKNRDREDITKPYYYIGKNLEYKLYIIKKINSIDELKDEMLNVVWKNIRIHNDIHNQIFSAINMIINFTASENIIKNTEYLLFPTMAYNSFIYSLFNMENSPICRKMNTPIEKKNKSNNKNISVNLLYKALSKIIDRNVISMICEYHTDINDIFMEIMHLKYNVKKSLIKHIMNNYNIYQFQGKDETRNKYITQIDDTFCITNEIGIPIDKTRDMQNIEYCICDGVNICTEMRCGIKNSIIEVLRKNKMFGKKDEMKYDKKHNIYKCLMLCPNTCEYRKTIKTNLALYMRYICNMYNYGKNTQCKCVKFHLRQFNTSELGFYHNKTTRVIDVVYRGENNKILIN